MEKIMRLKNLIEEALATHTGFEPYFLPSSNAWRDMPKILKPSEALKTGAAAYLLDFQRQFIEARSKAEKSSAFIKKELERIEGLFSLPAFTFSYVADVTRDNKFLKKEEVTFHYDFDAIEADLPQGRIKGESQDGVICYLLATANFYLWLKEFAAQTANKEPEEFRQIWLNPAEDIPFVLEALKDLEFIDENENWKQAPANKLKNPLAVIHALTKTSKGRFFYCEDFGKLGGKTNLVSDTDLVRAFCERFNIPQKRYEPKGRKNYELPMKQMKEYLDKYL